MNEHRNMYNRIACFIEPPPPGFLPDWNHHAFGSDEDELATTRHERTRRSAVRFVENTWERGEIMHAVFEQNQAQTVLENEIKRASQMLTLKEDWDDNGAIPIQMNTWERAIEFLKRLIAHYTRTSVSETPIPTISPCPDGTIDIFWNTKMFQLLVNIVPIDKGLCDYSGESASGLTMAGRFDPDKHLLFALEALSIR